ncbi:hypothetical protein [Psychrobacter sp.]|uniref:NUDIX hydrolase n=1 Tax=Psychrobacter sp. TaxID=56811 RepID=UPI0025F75523|nr:hypothetical protein [Psychrobacter sp.]
MSLSFSHAHSEGSGTTEVVAVLIAITNSRARVLTVDGGKLLPNGPLMPLHRSLQAGVRQWVEEQTQQPLGYIEQLYTFVDTNRRNIDGHALVYVSYMGLVQEAMTQPVAIQKSTDINVNKTLASSSQSDLSYDDVQSSHNQARWRDWYDYFPYENHLIDESNTQQITHKLKQWADAADSEQVRIKRLQRIYLCWGGDWEQDSDFKQVIACEDRHSSSAKEMFNKWVAEHALLRYEMLYEAGLLPESPDYNASKLPKNWHRIIGEPMYYDHRRVIATAISRLRAKIEYRPLIFGLMPDEFTLLQLQQSVEALSGVPLHKQNFRRLLESQNLLEPTGNSSQVGRGRPAKLYRFRFDINLQSLLMDSKLPKSNSR